jgi:large subunit ribosomal protein L25
MDRFSLDAEVRPNRGKGAAHKARDAGRVPAVVYRAGEAAQAVAVDAKALAGIFRKANDNNTLLDVKVGGTTRTCVVRDLQRHPRSRAVEHIDFLEVRAGEQVQVKVPVTAVGKAAGTKQGGTLRVLARELPLRCDAFAIPRTIEVDVSALEVDQFVKASQVKVPAGVSLVYRQDYNVVTVEGKKAEPEPVAAAAAAPGAAAAAPADGKAPAAGASAAAPAADDKKAKDDKKGKK